jgi:hypothetical protein
MIIFWRFSDLALFVVDQTATVLYSLAGGATGVLIFSTIYQAYHTWRQTKEQEIQTAILIMIFEKLEGRR